MATVGAEYAFIPTASDADGDKLSFSASNLPSWASLDKASGKIAGMPAADDLGTYSNIVLSVSDGKVSVGLPPFAITVYEVSAVQTVSAQIASGVDDVEEQADGAMYVDSSDLELIYDGENQVVGLRFSVPIPPNSIVTQANLRFTADEVTTGTTNLAIWAEASDDAPAFSTNSNDVSSRASTVKTSNWVPAPWNSVGESGSSQTTGDLSAVIQEVIDRPGWKENNHLVLVLSGSGARTAVAYEGDAASAAVLTIRYSGGGNQAPSIAGIPGSGATVGSPYSFTPTASDPDGDTLVFSIANKPSWATFNAATGELGGTPPVGTAGTYDSIGITVSDGKLSASLAPFSIVVSNVMSNTNHAPSITGTPVASVAEGAPYSFTPSATDADSDSLTFSIANKPGWASFDTASGNLSGTPSYGDAGTYSNIAIRVSDGTLYDTLAPFSITVANSNRPPAISGTPAASVAEGAPYSFTPTATDADGDNLTFGIVNKPGWASFNTATGTLSGTADAGTYSGVVISVSDGVVSTSLGPFSIAVSGNNQPPTISGTPAASVAENASYSFTPTAGDPDGDDLTFSISGQPAWASFNKATGTLSGTPGYDAADTYGNIVITVNDGTASASLEAFSITVTNVNQAPVISGTPTASVKTGVSYDFTPSASDGDGDDLSFSVDGLPAWASFDSATGKLSGTPQDSDAGEYGGISISVSDGTKSVSLATFAITVEAATATKGSMTLKWVAPKTRSDGSALNLSEIGGYVIYLGNSSSDLTMEVDLNDGAATSHVIKDLEVGTYFVAVTAYDVDGNMSSYSNVLEKEVTQ